MKNKNYRKNKRRRAEYKICFRRGGMRYRTISYEHGMATIESERGKRYVIPISRWNKMKMC